MLLQDGFRTIGEIADGLLSVVLDLHTIEADAWTAFLIVVYSHLET